jgi:hypothetical protein
MMKHKTGLLRLKVNAPKLLQILPIFPIYLLSAVFRMAANTGLNSIRGLIYIMEIQRVLC